MLNLDNTKIKIKCPNCSFSSVVTFKDIKLEKTIICKGCKRNIKLIDKNSSVKNSKQRVEESLKGLRDSLKKLN